MGSILARINGAVPTHQELWALAHTEGFEEAEALLQIAPDPSLPVYCAVVYGTLGLDEMHIGLFKVVPDDDGTPYLSLRVLGESEGPVLATCPPALLNATPEPSDLDDHYWRDWRKRCRDFALLSHIAASDGSRLTTLQSLADSGRLIISHIR